jgi:type VI secretion system protein ImpI
LQSVREPRTGLEKLPLSLNGDKLLKWVRATDGMTPAGECGGSVRMLISLKIDNVGRLPDGGPLIYRSQDRSFGIGREAGDWTLPDPDKFISRRHCEVRYEQGAFWLYDVSRNGTFVNGASQRVASPYRLGHGDRLRIGRYVVSVEIGMDRPGPVLEPVNGEASSYHPGRDSGHRSRSPGAFLLDDREGSPVRQTSGSGAYFSSEPFVPAAPSGPSPRAMPVPPVAARQGPADPPASALLRVIAAGAGVSPEVFEQRDAREVAAEMGAVLRVLVDEMALLLKARAAAKALVKSPDRTMIGPADNNPLKFVPGSEDILDIMFARRRTGYLDARRSVEEAFRDLKAHEFATYAAMQAALSRLLDELSPEAIEKKLPPASFASKKARAWDAFVASWEAREDAHENGMLDIFLSYFSEAYAKAAKPK